MSQERSAEFCRGAKWVAQQLLNEKLAAEYAAELAEAEAREGRATGAVQNRIKQLEAMNAGLLRHLSNIRIACKPANLKAPDGKEWTFHPPDELVRQYWGTLSKAVQDALASEARAAKYQQAAESSQDPAGEAFMPDRKDRNQTSDERIDSALETIYLRYGTNLAQFFEDVKKMEAREEADEVMMSKIHTSIDQGRYNEARTLLEDAEGKLGPDHADLLHARSLLYFMETPLREDSVPTASCRLTVNAGGDGPVVVGGSLTAAEVIAAAHEALLEIDDYRGGAETVLEDEYVTERRMDALATIAKWKEAHNA